MKHQMRILQGLKLAAVLAAALSMGACANKNLADGAMASAATPGSQQDFVVNVGDRVFFESDQTDLTPQAVVTLEKQARWLQSYNRYAFTIEGHADERGTREYNIALGARRAQSVRTFLASRGIDASRMRTISYGKERPVAVCNDISCWSQNRRAVTVLNANSKRSVLAEFAAGAFGRRFLFWGGLLLQALVCSVTFLAYSVSQCVPLSDATLDFVVSQNVTPDFIALPAPRRSPRCWPQRVARRRQRNPMTPTRRCELARGSSLLENQLRGSSPARTRSCSDRLRGGRGPQPAA